MKQSPAIDTTMLKEDKDAINRQLQQIRNISILLKSLFKPVQQTMNEFNCTESEAIERIEKAHDFLKKYGVDYLESAETKIREIVDNEYTHPMTPEELANNILKIGDRL